LSSTGPVLNSNWLHRQVYFLAAGFMFVAVVLRTILIFQNYPFLGQVLLSLAAWLFLFVVTSLLAARRPWFQTVCIALECGLILLMLLITEQDFFAVLFAITSMQAMQRNSPRTIGILIGLLALLTFLALFGAIGPLQALALALIYAALGAFLSAYIWSTRRAEIVQAQQQALLSQLQEANLKLEYHARQQKQLAAGRERQHLARELHDSVTQTIFSMTLTTQSALLLLDRDRQQVPRQLDRLDQLAQSALSEMQVLISRLAPQVVAGGNFISTLQRHIEERRRLDNLMVTLDVEGCQPLQPAEEASLFRIIQEALNNIVRYAKVSQASLRLHLTEPSWIEVEDHGVGCNLQEARKPGRMGLAGMRERAIEIGWVLRVDSAPGVGTRIRVEKAPGGK
jgi:signal transduction histidine kinase